MRLAAGSGSGKCANEMTWMGCCLPQGGDGGSSFALLANGEQPAAASRPINANRSMVFTRDSFLARCRLLGANYAACWLDVNDGNEKAFRMERPTVYLMLEFSTVACA